MDAQTYPQSLVTWVERWEPDFREGIAGAADEQIRELEGTLGVELPAVYRVFLAHMGHSHNGLNAYGDDNLRMDVLALQAFARDPELCPDPREFLCVGAPRPGVEGLFFDMRAGPAANPPLVRLAAGGARPTVIAEHPSLPAMLFGFAFLLKALPCFEHQIQLRSPGTVQPRFPGCPPGTWLPRFRWIADRLGFHAVPETGPWWACQLRSDATVMMYEAPGWAPDVRVGARDRRTAALIAEILMDNLDLRIYSAPAGSAP
ncbi:hypothetical protein SAMN02745121_03313 [Nannocystis exedens]|uniref:Knr4/Smi1-like domain-containing protein n=1 Tax=Nannocystis exedens TaxID=54 RepID=A0A1I1YLP2_9BACT|nr:SMI1/KNR4 family protein [Nannocystis exedens]PCC70358.1 hypothetical protein NAEX_03401 [Nannocystis exedens]SFE19063.1 hypothetical protein SAMN02745121_03313 [Nannocystis exedens]